MKIFIFVNVTLPSTTCYTSDQNYL